MTVLLVALGAALGAPLRYLTDRLVQSRHGSRFPWGTLTVNMAGSLVLGFLTGLPVGPAVAALLGTGFCGALTTFSTLQVETIALAREGAAGLAVAYALASLAAGMAAAVLATRLAGRGKRA